MKTSTAQRVIALDTDDTVALFASVFGGLDASAQGLEVRIRYLQKMPFPDDERAGRGKRTVHDVTNILKLLTALALMNTGISAARAAVTVRAFWRLFAAVLADAWNDVRADADSRERSGRFILVELNDLFQTDRLPVVETATRSEVMTLIGAAASNPMGRLVVNPWGLVAALRKALNEVHRYRDDEIVAAFSDFANQIRA